VLRSKVRTHKKHATRPWRLRVSMSSPAGQALYALGTRALKFVQDGKWVVQPAGPDCVERAAYAFWCSEAYRTRTTEPRAETCGPDKVLAWVAWASEDVTRAWHCGIGW
jgi:hypothetical protein